MASFADYYLPGWSSMTPQQIEFIQGLPAHHRREWVNIIRSLFETPIRAGIYQNREENFWKVVDNTAALLEALERHTVVGAGGRRRSGSVPEGLQLNVNAGTPLFFGDTRRPSPAASSGSSRSSRGSRRGRGSPPLSSPMNIGEMLPSPVAPTRGRKRSRSRSRSGSSGGSSSGSRRGSPGNAAARPVRRPKKSRKLPAMFGNINLG